jgi:glutathione gamma-glutamylcysteinyltransferase
VQEGVTLDQVECLASCNGVDVEKYRFGTFTYERFRQKVAESTALGTSHLIVSYARKAFKQTGDGHFSPIGGFHPEKEVCLILDTARFKYPPHWVPLKMLYEAMGHADQSTGTSKPEILMQPHAHIGCLR